MRPWLMLIFVAWMAGCTNDYGELRFPKVAPSSTDSGVTTDAGSADGD